MNPIPLSTPDGEVLAYVCGHCRKTIGTIFESHVRADAAEECCRCWRCKKPRTTERKFGEWSYECHTCSFMSAVGEFFENFEEAVTHGITNEDVWYAWQSYQGKD